MLHGLRAEGHRQGERSRGGGDETTTLFASLFCSHERRTRPRFHHRRLSFTSSICVYHPSRAHLRPNRPPLKSLTSDPKAALGKSDDLFDESDRVRAALLGEEENWEANIRRTDAVPHTANATWNMSKGVYDVTWTPLEKQGK